QPVTLTATGVSGKPPLTYAWTIKNDTTTATVATGSGNSAFVWDTSQLPIPVAGAYTATVTVNNGSGSASQAGHFSLAPLAALPTTSFAPTNDAFTSGSVQFHVAASGATAWNWDFGDGSSTGWTSDPINGPNPLHVYTARGAFNVTVQVRNCQQAAVTSAPLPVTISILTPLVASFTPSCLSPFSCAVNVGDTVTFVDSSTGAEHYDWDWDGDGTFEDVDHPPVAGVITHVYTQASPNGTAYTPRLRVRRGATEQDIASSPKGIFVGGSVTPPSISIGGATSGSPNTPYTYTASASACTPGATWSWSVGDGSISGGATGASITVSWATAGSKFITVTNAGCSGTQGSLSVNISSGNGGGGGGGG